MEWNVKTKYNIGDVAYIRHYLPLNGSNDIRLAEILELKVDKTIIKNIKIVLSNKKNEIFYLCEGLERYGDGVWIPEKVREPVLEESIYSTLEDAEKAQKKYEKFINELKKS